MIATPSSYPLPSVAEWSSYRIVVSLVTSSSPVPLKSRRVGQRCTLNLSRAETSSRWCGVVVRRAGASSGVIHVTWPWFKITGPSPKALVSTKKIDINSAPFISLCLDESIDITKSARLAVFARYCVENIIKEELIAITSLLTTKVTDICTAVRNSPAEKEVDLKKIVSVTTDGAQNLVGKKKNCFISLFKTDVGHSILECHCIIHQQALCAKSGLTSLDKVITLVTKIDNLISSQALNKRKFDALLDEVDSVYNGLIKYNNVRWLSRGNVLQRCVVCLEEIRLFLQNESKIEQYPQLMDIMWLLKLMFFTDICQHFNELNIKLQGSNKTVIVMMDLIHAFEAKLYVFKNTILLQKTQVLPKLEKNIKDLDAQEKGNEEKVIDDFISIMDSLRKEFSARVSQFKELSETFKFIMYPDVISFDKLNLSQFDWFEIEELEMQLIDFQSSSIWIQKFIETRKKLELIEAERLTRNISKNTSNEILETWNSIPDALNCLKKLAYAILTIFSSTYARESLFSEINNIKDSLRNRLTDDSNSACILL
ncbi:general transcription factor II-I repeat domain-containing protein 2A [Trichonephila clavipes]|nr:general transcription factor II-I repeat domain-containing protein 2A [Trichonephila clavipes]